MQRLYPAVIDKDPSSDFGITFPDFPGCVSAGATAEEAIAMGAEALAGHITLMAEDGDAIPLPTPLDRVEWADDENVVCVTLVGVTIPGRSKRINISLDEGLIAEIDAADDNRSGFLAKAARAELARRRATG